MPHSRYLGGFFGRLFFGKDVPPKQPEIDPSVIGIVTMLALFIMFGLLLYFT